MTSTTSAGSRWYISAAAPVSQDAAAYDAVSYTEVIGVESIPAFGAQSAVNRFQPLNGPEEKHKGPVNYGSLQIPFAYDKADAGQTIVRTGGEPDNNALYTHKVVFPNGDKRFFQGRVFGAQETIGSATNVLMQSALVEINTKVFKLNA